MKSRPVIAVDAMGGDHAPHAVVEGAIMACRDSGVGIILVGNQRTLWHRIKHLAATHLPITIQHAPDVVSMNENPLDVMRKKKGSSIAVGIELVATAKAQAFFSAGNSGAIVSAALLRLKRIKGIDRPAIAATLPSLRGSVIITDAGASTMCRPFHLAQFALMSASFGRCVLKRPIPRVGLLSNGEEYYKGTDTIRGAHALLKNSSLSYVGYIEGNSIYKGDVDVVVCDGFTGNILLKTAEGVAESITMATKQELRRSWLAGIGYLFLSSGLHRLQKRFDYAEYGGAPLLGVNGTVVIGHGKSSARAVASGIRVARHMIDTRLTEHLSSDLDVNGDINTIGRKPSLISRIFQPKP